MKRTVVFLAGAALMLAGLAAQASSENEERFRAKYGRYTQAHQRREKVLTTVAAPVCCRNMTAAFRNEPREGFAEVLFRGKYGRSTPAVAARENLAAEANANHVRMCVELGRCSLMHAEDKYVAAPKTAPADARAGASYRAKYGRIPGKNGEQAQLAAAMAPCEHECCKRSDRVLEAVRAE